MPSGMVPFTWGTAPLTKMISFVATAPASWLLAGMEKFSRAIYDNVQYNAPRFPTWVISGRAGAARADQLVPRRIAAARTRCKDTMLGNLKNC